MRPALAIAALGVAVAAALALLCFGAWVCRRLLRGCRRRRRAMRVVYPVVLAHGVLGFDTFTVAGVRHDYFRGLARQLERHGARVFAVRLPPTSSVAARAEALCAAVRELGAKRVNIIAHSMGGLDARYAISCLGLANKVESLITIGTPHRGTPLADVGTELLGERCGLRKICDALTLDVEAFWDITTARMDAFNKTVRNSWRVTYASYVAVCPAGWQVNPVLLPSHFYLSRCVGENDGLVPAASQAWGEVLGRIEADHWAQIGWGRGFDANAFYEEVLHELAVRGC